MPNILRNTGVMILTALTIFTNTYLVQGFVHASTANPYQAKFTTEYITAIDQVIQNIANKGKNLAKDKYAAYLSRVADGIKTVAALPKYRSNPDIQNIAGYIAYEIDTMRTEATKDTSFLEDMSAVANSALSGDSTSTPAATPATTVVTPVTPVVTPAPTSNPVVQSKVPTPIFEVQNMRDNSAYLSWTIVKGQKYTISYTGVMGGSINQQYDFTSVLTGNSGCTYERKEGEFTLCSGKWNNFPGNYVLQTYTPDGQKSTQYPAKFLSVNSGKFSWEDAYSYQQVELRKAEMIAKEDNRPGNTASGAVVRTLSVFTGKLWGLAGANAKCLQQLQENEWVGKDRFTLDEDHVRAYLCDAVKCQNLKPNTSYYSTNLQAYQNDPTIYVDSPKGGKTYVQNIDLALWKTDRYGRLTATTDAQWVPAFNNLYRDSWGYSFIGWSGRQGHMSSAANTCDSWTSEEPTKSYHSRPIDSYYPGDKLGAVARKYVSNHYERDEEGNRSKSEQVEYSNSGESCGLKQSLICAVEL